MPFGAASGSIVMFAFRIQKDDVNETSVIQRNDEEGDEEDGSNGVVEKDRKCDKDERLSTIETVPLGRREETVGALM